MKITILKYDHRHGCDLSAYRDQRLANHARAEICARVAAVDDRAYVRAGVAPPLGTPPADGFEGMTLSQRVTQLFTVGQYNACVDAYLAQHQDESLDLEEVEVHGMSPAEGILFYRGSASDLATDIKATLTPYELERLLEGLRS